MRHGRRSRALASNAVKRAIDLLAVGGVLDANRAFETIATLVAEGTVRGLVLACRLTCRVAGRSSAPWEYGDPHT